MGQVRDYEALIRELLVGVAGGWGYGGVEGLLMGKVKEPELAQWLREHGAALGADEVVRGQLGCLAGLGRGELVRGWESEVDESEEWLKKGDELYFAERYEEAIASCDRAIEIKPDYHQAWSNRGDTLDDLGQYENAIASYDRAIEIEPNYHNTWFNQGVMMVNSGRYEKAIASYDQAIKIKPNSHQAWYGRGVAIGLHKKSYRAEIEAYQEAFQHIHSDTHPEGYGFLQHKIGRTHYDEGNNQLSNDWRDSHLYYGQALTSYKEALTTLTREQFPKLRLETLIDTAKAYLAQNNPSAASECQTEALTIWLELIDAQSISQGKKRLYIEYSYLLRTQVDLSILDGEPIRALEIAEFDKNKHLEWFLYAQEQQLRDWLKTYDTANLDTVNWQELGNILEVSKINHQTQKHYQSLRSSHQP